MSQEANGKVSDKIPKTEVVAKAKRRQYTAEYKLRILRELDGSQGAGETGALLRREGLYSSHLTTWRRQRERGELNGLSPQRQEAAMKESKEEKRARLLAKAAEVIDQYLEWEEENPEPDLTQIEDIALKLRKELGQEITQLAIDNQASRTPVPGPKCPQCGQEMRYKGKKRTRVESRTGNLDVERGYYTCPKCKERIFPPGSAVEVERQELERGDSPVGSEV